MPPVARMHTTGGMCLTAVGAFALLLARLLIIVAPSRTLRRAASRRRHATPADVVTHAAARAIARVAARGPLIFTCLEQAVALVLLLPVVGRRGQVVFAVAATPVPIRAHAWVECGGEVVLGGGEAARGLRPLEFPGGPRAGWSSLPK